VNESTVLEKTQRKRGQPDLRPGWPFSLQILTGTPPSVQRPISINETTDRREPRLSAPRKPVRKTIYSLTTNGGSMPMFHLERLMPSAFATPPGLAQSCSRKRGVIIQPLKTDLESTCPRKPRPARTRESVRTCSGANRNRCDRVVLQHGGQMSARRIPELDGIRGLAIALVLVLLSH
jgi:hypothetical protein